MSVFSFRKLRPLDLTASIVFLLLRRTLAACTQRTLERGAAVFINSTCRCSTVRGFLCGGASCRFSHCLRLFAFLRLSSPSSMKQPQLPPHANGQPLKRSPLLKKVRPLRGVCLRLKNWKPSCFLRTDRIADSFSFLRISVCDDACCRKTKCRVRSTPSSCIAKCKKISSTSHDRNGLQRKRGRSWATCGAR